MVQLYRVDTTAAGLDLSNPSTIKANAGVLLGEIKGASDASKPLVRRFRIATRVEQCNAIEKGYSTRLKPKAFSCAQVPARGRIVSAR